MTSTGTTAFLQQAHRNNWQRYLASLRPGARRGWDVCVLTASDERQAQMYRRQLAWRRASGLLPAGTQFLVLPDPPGRRIGSGGATLRALARVQGSRLKVEGSAPSDLEPFGELRAGSSTLNLEPSTSIEPSTLNLPPAPRILIIHSGGDSKRLPHCSAIGKLFARVPRVLPDGRASTIFDEFLISLSGLAGGPSGALIASGDVLLIFDHLQLSFRRGGVTGVAAAAPAEMGLRHGVYASGVGGQRVIAYLHKPAAPELARWDATAADGTVQIDTGLVWLDTGAVDRVCALAQDPAVAAVPLNLYGDLLLPLAESTSLEAYLADVSDGPATPAVQAARRTIWERLRDSSTPLSFGVERLQPAVFVHFGSSQEYWRMVAGDADLAALCGWQANTASWSAASEAVQPSTLTLEPSTFNRQVLINAQVDGPLTPGPEPLLAADCRLAGPVAWHGPALISGVDTSQPLVLSGRVVLDQWPLASGRFVTRLFGLSDDPKRGRSDPAATFVNRPWADWLAAAGIMDETIWPDTSPDQRTLWNARLFPALADREASLALALPLQDPAAAEPGWLSAWTTAPRLSLAESFAASDGERLLGEVAALEDAIAVRRFVAAVAAERPAGEAAPLLGAYPEVRGRRAPLAAAAIAAADPVFRWRGYTALTVATGDPTWEDRAFAGLAEMIEESTFKVQGSRFKGEGSRSKVTGEGPLQPSTLDLKPIRVTAAARIDFGGGWTDTPPYSIERGGAVLNAAITLRGEHPIIAEAAPLAEPRLLLESRDIDAVVAPRTAGEVLAYANPADPFALHKAALVLSGIVPARSDPAAAIADVLRPLGCGLRLATATTIPRGSGLGTSSILAGAVLASLHALQPSTFHLEPETLFDEVLCLEQMLTTGGGWQDQVGGLTGGIKLLTTRPGLPQQVHIAPVTLAPETAAGLADRLVMVYTGQQRLAKDLLRGVMGRWMARDPEMVWIQAEIARLAVAMRHALLGNDLDAFGALLGEHWTLNKRMDPGCTNPFIDDLFRTMGPFVNGGKLAGAGGGGFVSAIARDRNAVSALSAELTARYPRTPVAVWPCAVPDAGLKVEGAR